MGFYREDGTQGHDRYGQIKIRVTEDRMGHVLLRPISERRRKEVSSSNQYNGTCTVYLTDSQEIGAFMHAFPRAVWYNPLTRWEEINDGCIILIDSWTYRHMVGGQSD